MFRHDIQTCLLSFTDDLTMFLPLFPDETVDLQMFLPLFPDEPVTFTDDLQMFLSLFPDEPVAWDERSSDGGYGSSQAGCYSAKSGMNE